MSAQITYSATVPQFDDTQFLTLQKILQKTGGEITTISGLGMLHGSGNPVANPTDTAVVWEYIDVDTDNFWTWNPHTLTWVLQIGA